MPPTASYGYPFLPETTLFLLQTTRSLRSCKVAVADVMDFSCPAKAGRELAEAAGSSRPLAEKGGAAAVALPSRTPG